MPHNNELYKLIDEAKKLKEKHAILRRVVEISLTNWMWMYDELDENHDYSQSKRYYPNNIIITNTGFHNDRGITLPRNLGPDDDQEIHLFLINKDIYCLFPYISLYWRDIAIAGWYWKKIELYKQTT